MPMGWWVRGTWESAQSCGSEGLGRYRVGSLRARAVANNCTSRAKDWSPQEIPGPQCQRGPPRVGTADQDRRREGSAHPVAVARRVGRRLGLWLRRDARWRGQWRHTFRGDGGTAGRRNHRARPRTAAFARRRTAAAQARAVTAGRHLYHLGTTAAVRAAAARTEPPWPAAGIAAAGDNPQADGQRAGCPANTRHEETLDLDGARSDPGRVLAERKREVNGLSSQRASARGTIMRHDRRWGKRQREMKKAHGQMSVGLRRFYGLCG